jgi:Alginate export
LQLWGGIALWRHAAGNLNLELSGFQLSERDTPQLATRDRNLATIDARAFVPTAAGRFDLEVEGAWQWGRSRPGTSNAVPRAEVEAWYLHADAGYTFRSPWKPRLSAEFDVVSGDRPGGKYTRFDTIFGMRRADFSPGSILGYIGRANLLAPGLRLEVEPGPRTDGFASVRAMWAESRSDSFSQTGVRDPSGRSGRFAGWELDSRLRHWLIPKRLRGEIDTVVFLRRGLLQGAPNAPPGGTVVYFSASVIAPF